MTEEKIHLMELADFGAKFLKLLRVINFYFFPAGSWHVFTIKDSERVDTFFNDPEYAPQLANLALEEMENRGFSIRCEHRSGYQRVFIKRDDVERDWQLSLVYVEDENKFKALWSAIKETGEK